MQVWLSGINKDANKDAKQEYKKRRSAYDTSFLNIVGRSGVQFYFIIKSAAGQAKLLIAM